MQGILTLFLCGTIYMKLDFYAILGAAFALNVINKE